MTPLRGLLDRTDALLEPYADWAGTVVRVGLGISFLIGGGYKILEPAVYQAYFAPIFMELWPTAIISLDLVFMLAGLFEVLFGLLILADWHTPTIAGLAVPWLIGTNTNFVVAIAQGEPTVDLLGLYVALMMMAAGVSLEAAVRRSQTDDSIEPSIG